MTQTRWPVLVPFGLISLATPGTTVSLAVNSGPLGGQVGGTFQSPPISGQALRQIVLTNTGTTGVAYLLPLGQTASSNPGNIFCAIPPGQTVYLPSGQPFENGLLPENYVLDCSAICTVYGCGILS